MPKLMSVVVGAFLSSMVFSGFAHDLGVMGQSYPVKEIDIKEIIADQAAHTDWNKVGDQLKSSTKSYFKRLPQFDLTTVNQTHTRYVNPSVAYNQNFYAKGRLIYRKGTPVNPLAYVRPSTNMLFINGNDDNQVKFALSVLHHEPIKTQVVLTGGNPRELSKQFKRALGFANQQILDRFHIKHVPSMLGVGRGDQYFDLAITDFAYPYRVKLAELCWHGCSDNVTNNFQKHYGGEV